MMSQIWQNLRYALRVLGKNPWFTTVAVLSLALGIGANTAIFTLMNAVLLRDLPVRQPERLVRLRAVRPDAKVPFSYPMFREVERNQRVFTGLMGWGFAGAKNVDIDGVLAQDRVTAVTGDCYSELGVTPLLGRLLNQDDSDPGKPLSQVAVLGYEFWQRRFGGASEVIGKQMRIEGHPFTIVGITRKWFMGMTVGEPPEITIPLTAYPSLTEGNEFQLDSRSILWISPIGRLKEGTTIEQARAQLESIWHDALLATASTEAPGPRRDRFLSMSLEISPASKGFGDLRDDFARPLKVLTGIVGLILVLGCVNLANLMLARGAAREHEMSVRMAIGASRWSLAQQVLAESVSLSLIGGLLGLALAFWGSRLLVLLMTEGRLFKITLDLTPDLRVLVVTSSVAVLTGILFGLAPAWRSSRQDPSSLLQQSARSLTGATRKVGKVLMVTQIALSVVLLLGAGLLVSSFEKLRNIDLGFRKESILQFSLYPRPGGYQHVDMSAYHHQVLDRISALPGVGSAGFSTADIPSADVWHDTVSVASADPSTALRVMTNAAEVSPRFFRMLGIPLVRGRAFYESDDEHHPRVAVISNSLAEQLFPSENAIGKRIRFSFMPNYQNLEIVGVAGDARVFNLRDPATPAIYLSYFQFPEASGNLLVRAKDSPRSVAKAVTQEIDALGHEYALNTKTIDQVVDGELVEERVIALLSGFFAVLALLLASIGLYGLMTYAVMRRTREIGVRVAVGAQQKNVLAMVLRETLVLALAGIAVGIPMAVAACRLVSSLLFGLSPSDLPTIMVVSLVLLVVAVMAGYLPARRASGIDPIVALRAE